MLAVSGINFLQKTNSASTFNNQQRPSVKMHSQPLQDTVNFKGLPANFGEVIAGKFYRSSLPSDFEAISRQGVKYVLDLSDEVVESEQANVEAAGMTYIREELPDVTKPEEYVPAAKELANKIIALMEKGAVLAHCQKGEKNTGAFVAVVQRQLPEPVDRAKIKEHAFAYFTPKSLIFTILQKLDELAAK